MSRLIECPFHEDVWVKLPDVWLGEHAEARDVAVAACQETGTGETMTNFAVALAIVDDHRLPGLNGKPDQWDFGQMELSLITWVNGVVLPPFLAKLYYPLLSSNMLRIGQDEKDQDKAPGGSDEEE